MSAHCNTCGRDLNYDLECELCMCRSRVRDLEEAFRLLDLSDNYALYGEGEEDPRDDDLIRMIRSRGLLKTVVDLVAFPEGSL